MGVDNTVKQKVVSFLGQLGLDNEQTSVYLYLLKHGPGSVLSISRGLGSGRTKLYPLLEELANKRLILVHERHYGTSYQALPPESLEYLVLDEERKTDGLRKTLPSVLHILQDLHQLSPATSRVVEYRGIDGMKQLLWNLTKASKEILWYEAPQVHNQVGQHYLDKLAAIWMEKQIRRRVVTNKSDWKLDTKVKGYAKLSLARCIDTTLLKIVQESYIYNNCVSILSTDGTEIAGIELYGELLAGQQRQLFDVIWSQARDLAQS